MNNKLCVANLYFYLGILMMMNGFFNMIVNGFFNMFFPFFSVFIVNTFAI